MIVNGKNLELHQLQKPSLLELIKYFKLRPEMVAVERNGTIEDRNQWDTIHLTDEDKIELIKFIGGG